MTNSNLASPHSITLTFRRIENIVKVSNDFETAANILNTLLNKPFDPVYFTEDQIEALKNEIDLCVLYMTCELANGFDESFEKIREMLSPIYVKNLWFAGRLLTQKDIGTLADLPQLFKYQLYQRLIRDL